MRIVIIDKLGLCYDGTTLERRGLGGSESAVILISKNLAQLGFDVTVFNNCRDSTHSGPGVYDGVRYIDNSDAHAHTETYDFAISSRSVIPLMSEHNTHPFVQNCGKRILWLHDTFIEGDQIVEDLLLNGTIDHVFTLSDFHTDYFLNCDHGKKRNFEVLKRFVFQTRNGAVQHIPEVDLSLKDPNHFVFNASMSKGMLPLVNQIWPRVKQQIPDAHLTIIGGFYRFRENAEPDSQEVVVSQLADRPDLKELDVTFTGVIPQYEIARILANASFTIYPGSFPETFGISSLESLLYNTPVITTRFGALEETAVEQACYLLDYAIEPNGLFPHIDNAAQVDRFVELVISAYNNRYLLQQKQNYCNVVRDVAGWDTVALQWKQFLYGVSGEFLPVDEYHKVSRINEKVAGVFGRVLNFPAKRQYRSYGKQRRIVVVSPFWNAGSYVRKNILSVAQQDYDNYLHIIINDASTDNSHSEAVKTINSLPPGIADKFKVIDNIQNQGAIYNQLTAVEEYVNEDDIVILLDGDDWLANNNTIFHYYNDLYNQGYEFTYGSMWSVIDNIPLIAQEYPSMVKKNKSYRSHWFNWRIPYTHLRTVLGRYIKAVNWNKFKNPSGDWMRSGHDNPLFYELIEQVEPEKIYCNQEIVCYYNDANPLNDYKVRGEEQNRNADMSYKNSNVPSKAYILRTSNSNSIEYAKAAAESCERVGLAWEYFEGIEGKTAAEAFAGLPINGDVNDIAACATASHFAIWRRILENRETAIVLEHDSLMLHPVDIPIPDNRIVALGYKFKNIGIYDYTRAGPPARVVDVPRHSGAHAYALTWRTCESLLTEIDKNGVTRAIDNFYFMRVNQPGDTESSVPLAIADPTPAICWIRQSTIWEDPSTLNYELLPSFSENIVQRKEMKKILIAVPTNKYIETETFKSIYDLEIPEGYTTEFQFFYGYQIDQIRNLIAEWAKRYDYLFSVDSDIVLPADTLKKMLDADRDIISGLYIQRVPGLHVLEVYKDTGFGGVTNIPYEELHNKEITEIASCGFGCCLIKGEVFRKLEYPHFVYTSALDHSHTISEDIYFCRKARENGFSVWVDPSIKCEHIGATKFLVKNTVELPEPQPVLQQPDPYAEQKQILEMAYHEDRLPEDHRRYLKIMGSMGIKPKVIYDIGACVLHWTRHAKTVWPDSNYYLFDAMEECRPYFEKSQDSYYIGLLSDQDGKELKFYQHIWEPGGNSYYKETTGRFDENDVVMKTAWTLDTVVKYNNWPLPDLVKLDIQGSELDVLRGAEYTLSNCKDIILEAQHTDYNEGAPKVEEVIEYMRSIGYELVSNFSRVEHDGDYHFRKLDN
jgi:FkbM family methyltransferase